MRRKTGKLAAVLLGIVMTSVLFTGCGGRKSDGTAISKKESGKEYMAKDPGVKPILGKNATLTSLGLYGDTDSTGSEGSLDEEEKTEDLDERPEIFSSRMFWGNWVLMNKTSGLTDSDAVGTDSGTKDEDTDFSVTNAMVDVKLKDYSTKIECLPAGLNLGSEEDSGIGGKTLDLYEFSDGTYGEVGFQKSKEVKKAETKEEEVQNAIEEGDGIRSIGAPKGDRSFNCIYKVKDNVLAIGILDKIDSSESQEGDSLKIRKELDYKFKWNGPYLTLQYGDEKATYVPERFQDDNNNKVIVPQVQRIGTTKDDGIINIAIGTDKDFVETKYGSPLNTTYSFNEDQSSLKIVDGTGHDYKCDNYYYSGNTLTLKLDDEIDIFRVNNDVMTTMTENIWKMMADSLSINGEPYVNLDIGDSVGTMLEGGFATDINTEISVPSRQLVEFDVSYGGCVLHVKALNCYEKEAPVSECTVAAISADSKSEGASYATSGLSEGDLTIGKTRYLDAKKAFPNFYQADKKELIYKGMSRSKILSFETTMASPYGSHVIETNYDYDIVFSFDQDILTKIDFEIPAYLYGGLDENIDHDELTEMSQDEINNTVSLRSNFLSKLQDAFKNANVSVDIEPSTGVIRMANDILFDTASYEVKEDGKKYISQIMNVVSSVVLENDVKDIISKVEISGHTDITGDFDSNKILSIQRAQAVWNCYMNSSTNTLTESQKQEMQDLVDIEGYSSSNPIFDENGQPDNDKSRRVEVRFFINTGLDSGSSEASASTGK